MKFFSPTSFLLVALLASASGEADPSNSSSEGDKSSSTSSSQSNANTNASDASTNQSSNTNGSSSGNSQSNTNSGGSSGGGGFADPMPLQLPNGNYAIAQANGPIRQLIPRPGQSRTGRRVTEQQQRHLKAALENLISFESPSPQANLDFDRYIWFQLSGVNTGTLVLEGPGDAPLSIAFDKAQTDADPDTDEMDLFLSLPKPGRYTWSVEGVQGGGSFNYVPPSSSGGGDVVMRAKQATTKKSSNANDDEGGDGMVEEAPYEGGGQVNEAIGRIYYSSYGVDYACTGTAVKDHKTGRSLVFTAAHCVWDDIDEHFGTNAIFIPNRDAVTGHTVLEEGMTMEDIHRQCADDICGCWELSGGVVHDLWPSTPWPERLEYDYAFYVVNDEGAHTGPSCGSDALDIAVDVMDFHVGDDIYDAYMYNFGYSLEFNPDFRYCAEKVVDNEPMDGMYTAWMDHCGLTGGASGGPWIKGFDSATGRGQVVSVNSWQYSNYAGIGAPYIDASAARCLVNAARNADMEWMMSQPEGYQGIYASCYDRPCAKYERDSHGRRLCAAEEDTKQ